MSNEYRECVLGDIGKISMCKRILKNQTSESGEIPFYKIASFGGIADCFISKELFEEYKNKYSYPNKGDILISAAGTLGRTVIFDGKPSYFQDSNIVWIDNDETKVCNNYLYYFYQTKPWIKTSGSTIDRLYNDNIRNIKIKYPMDINEQKKIINPLKLIDDKIETNNKINTELEAMAKTIYDYWFLQFEFPNEEGKPYKSSGGKMVWNEELKREIPEGWECKKISELCSFSNGINYDKNEIGDKNYKIINVRNITSSSILLDSNDLDEINLLSSQAEKYIIGSSDILVARSGSPGAIRLLYSSEKDIIYCGFIIKCSPNNDDHRLFLTYSLKILEGSNATKTGGSIMQNVSQDTLKQVRICLPTEDIIDKFNNTVNPIFQKMQQIINENKELTSLQNFLLPLLMNGQVGFKEVGLAL